MIEGLRAALVAKYAAQVGTAYVDDAVRQICEAARFLDLEEGDDYRRLVEVAVAHQVAGATVWAPVTAR